MKYRKASLFLIALLSTWCTGCAQQETHVQDDPCIAFRNELVQVWNGMDEFSEIGKAPESEEHQRWIELLNAQNKITARIEMLGCAGSIDR